MTLDEMKQKASLSELILILEVEKAIVDSVKAELRKNSIARIELFAHNHMTLFTEFPHLSRDFKKLFNDLFNQQ